MQKISVYFNHRASHSSQYWKEQIRNNLFRSEIIFRDPENISELKFNLQQDIADKVDSIVSVGGDGTVNTLIQDLAYQKVGLLVVPAGTANDLASELGNLNSLQKVIQYIRSEDYYFIDLIKINNRFMATNGGIGLGARVAHRINLIRKDHPSFKYLMRFTGKNIYSLFMAHELLSMRATPIHILIETTKFKKVFNAPIVLINNQSMLAGTFNIAPETNNSDGKFNVTIFCHPNRKSLAACIFKVMRGEIPKEDPHFLSFETDRLYLENLNKEKKVQFFGDGEIFEDEHCFDIHIAKSALKVYAHRRPCLQGEEIEKLHLN